MWTGIPSFARAPPDPPDLVLRWNAIPGAVPPPSTSSCACTAAAAGPAPAGHRQGADQRARPEPCPDVTARAGRADGHTTAHSNYLVGSGAAYNSGSHTARYLLRLVDDGLASVPHLDGSAPSDGRLVLTARSGGRAPSNAILRAADINEVQVFDGCTATPRRSSPGQRRVTSGPPAAQCACSTSPAPAQPNRSQRVGAAVRPDLAADPATPPGPVPRRGHPGGRTRHPQDLRLRLLADPPAAYPEPSATTSVPLARAPTTTDPEASWTDRMEESYAGWRRRPTASPKFRRVEHIAWESDLEGYDGQASEWQPESDRLGSRRLSRRPTAPRASVARQVRQLSRARRNQGAEALAPGCTRVSG